MKFDRRSKKIKNKKSNDTVIIRDMESSNNKARFQRRMLQNHS